MPPKRKKHKANTENLVCARESFRTRNFDDIQPSVVNSALFGKEIVDTSISEPENIKDLLNLSQEAANADNEDCDPSFSLDSSLKSDTQHQIETFCEEWVVQLSRDDRYSLEIFLEYHLNMTLGKSSTEAAELAGLMIGSSNRTICERKAKFYENDGSIPNSAQGQYQRSEVLWKNEYLNRKVCMYVRDNGFNKGSANLTMHSFCEWVNEHLLSNETLKLGYPRKISVESARRWLHELGLEVLTAKKGCFVDGHERQDVVECRNIFLRKMISLGFLNESNAPTKKARQSIPTDLHCPATEILDKTVIFS